ncbi:MAG: chemotaxis protein CheW [Planctomycetes bacterium]|nr:chemotaxis protein CheW [Planctomycetota bacterium]
MVASEKPPTQPSTVGKSNTSQFVGFQLADQEYLFRIEQIQEVVIQKQVTKTPQVPKYVEGVANLRGSIIPIINLRSLFGLEPKPADAETRTIVVNVGARNMGCTVDKVSQVMRIADESIRPAPETITANGAHYVAGFARIDGRLMIVLDINELLEPGKLDHINAAAVQELARQA